jgi:peptidoglycan hydrolase-like protein with peptidoglycan-binding domain
LSDYGWFQHILTVGSTGPDVELVQRKLKARVTGSYDRETMALVMSAQQQCSLPVTGMVDVVTASRI